MLKATMKHFQADVHDLIFGLLIHDPHSFAHLNTEFVNTMKNPLLFPVLTAYSMEQI